MDFVTDYNDEMTTDDNKIPVLPENDKYRDSCSEVEYDEEIVDDDGRILKPWDDDFEYWKAEHARRQELLNG